MDRDWDRFYEQALNQEMDAISNHLLDQTFDNLETRLFQSLQPPRRRAYIERNHEEGHIQLWNDYFSENPTYSSQMFRRRFRINKHLFIRIVDRLSAEYPIFQQREDDVGRVGLTPLQKATAAIRMLTYGCAADAVDKYIQIGQTTPLRCLESLVDGIINLSVEEYLRKPTPTDLQRLLDIREARGFPGMMGSIDCTLNDINVLDRSPVFDDILQGKAPKVRYIVNGNEYRLSYYLTDGIYPKWATFIQSIPLPQGPKASLFATHQEAAHKDVERAFGILQARFAIVKNPARFWDKEKVGKIMRACIILHNMIVEDERDRYNLSDISEFTQEQSSRTSEVDYTNYTTLPSNMGNILSNRIRVRNNEVHEQLKADLVENIWMKFDTYEE